MNYVSQHYNSDLFDIIYVYAHFHWFNFKLNVRIAECIQCPVTVLGITTDTVETKLLKVFRSVTIRSCL